MANADCFVPSSQSTTQKDALGPPMVIRLYLVREHRLHGIVTGVETVRIMSSIEDNLDRLLVSFKDAKVSFISVSERCQVDRTPS